MKKVSYGNYGYGYKENGKRYIQTVYSTSNMKSEQKSHANNYLCLLATSISKINIKMSQYTFPFSLSCNFKTGLKLRGHFSSHEHLSYRCCGSNLYNVVCHEVMMYASGTQ